MQSNRLGSLYTLLALVAAHVFGGMLVGRFFPAGPWVEQLTKPGFYPPGWAFPVAWTILYAMMGTSLFVFLRVSGRGRGLPLGLYCSQLVVNYLFTPLCFGLQSTLLGFIDVALLWGLLVATILSFLHASKLAAVLLMPYLLWVSFALVLAYELWKLNP